MPFFHYKCVDASGKKQLGVIDALHFTEAKEKLRKQRWIVLSIEMAKEKSSFLQIKKEHHLKGETLVHFTTQLAQLLKAGLPLYESLVSLEEEHRGDPCYPIFSSLCQLIKGGSSLSEALKHYPKSFNTMYCSMVEAGESSGALDLSLERLGKLLQKQMKLRKQMTTALLYPLVLACFSVVVVFLLLTFVIPSLESLFEDMRVNSFTLLVMKVSRFLRFGWIVYFPLILASLLGLIIFFKKPKGKLLYHNALVKIPLIKNLVIQSALARFSRTMGTLLQGGVAIIPALQISKQVIHHPVLEDVITQAEKRIIEGSLLSVELRKCPLIPSLMTRMLSISEEGGMSASMFDSIADLYEEEVEKTVSRLVALSQPVILLVMGFVVGIIMMAILLPLTDINAFIQ